MIHVVAAPAALIAGVVLAAHTETWRAGMSLLVMSVAYALIFTTSAVYHQRWWSPRVKRVLRHLDHAMIFVGMAGVYTALWIAILDGLVADIMLAYVWAVVIVGVLLKLRFIDARASLHSLVYVAFGLSGIVVVPGMLERAGLGSVLLMLAGGAVFILGAIAFAAKRPNPFPRLAGHHEVFHLSTVVGAGCHVAALAATVVH